MDQSEAPALSCIRTSVIVPSRLLVEELDLQLKYGELVAVLGQNGAGKSLSLHCLAGLRDSSSGRVFLDGEDVRDIPRQDVARQLALLPQHNDDVFPATVLDTVLIGRHPHIGRWQWESELDRQTATEALTIMDLSNFAERDVGTLSGGERRRVAIAQILAQAPQVYILDEPTNHLDPQHQLGVLQIFRRQAERGAAVIASLHDVNLAARFADRCLLLYGDGRWELGPTRQVLTVDRLTELYATPMEIVSWRDTPLFVASGGGIRADNAEHLRGD